MKKPTHYFKQDTGSKYDFAQSESYEKLITDFFAANGVKLSIVGTEYGPVITKYVFSLDSLTDRIGKVESLKDDLCLRLRVSSGNVRIGETEWGKGIYRTIEIPNRDRITVPASAVVPAIANEVGAGHGLKVCIGVDTSGKPYTIDLSKAPHMLVAGQSGSGKSVFLNSLICGLLDNYTSDDVHVSIVDPKGTEFNSFEHHPMIACPMMACYDGRDHFICSPDNALDLLEELVGEMEDRLATFKKHGVKNLGEYKQLYQENLTADDDHVRVMMNIRYWVVVIDEFYDLLLNYPELEKPLGILAAKARATGIHLVLATQRPSTDVIRGALKANLSTRIALKVSSGTDSSVIIDRPGAETLCGLGDMLYVGPEGGIPRRLHGCYVSDADIKAMTASAIEIRQCAGRP